VGERGKSLKEEEGEKGKGERGKREGLVELRR
jgi:hypothetical protein